MNSDMNNFAQFGLEDEVADEFEKEEEMKMRELMYKVLRKLKRGKFRRCMHYLGYSQLEKEYALVKKKLAFYYDYIESMTSEELKAMTSNNPKDEDDSSQLEEETYSTTEDLAVGDYEDAFDHTHTYYTDSGTSFDFSDDENDAENDVDYAHNVAPHETRLRYHDDDDDDSPICKRARTQ